MIDTHCHLNEHDFKNLSSLLIQIFEKRVKAIVVSGCDVASNKEAVVLAHKYDNIYATVGFHPSVAGKIKDTDLILLEEQLTQRKVIGLGEIGLDFYYHQDNQMEQEMLLEKQLALAKKHKMPVIIHNRAATASIYKYLKNAKVIGIMHCFNETEMWAKRFIELGFLLGVGGMITFKNASALRAVIKKIPLSYLVLETDAPYLTPEPFRGRQNNPLYLSYIVEKMGILKKMPAIDIIRETSDNAARLFDL